MENKKCNHCSRIRLITDFHIDYDQRQKKSYRMDVCIDCYVEQFVNEKKERQQAIMRQKVIAYLGGTCSWCGFNDPRTLQVDHIYGEGGVDRKSKRNWYTFYKDILDGKRDLELQVLCANCNSIKKYKYERLYKSGKEIYS